MKIANVERPHKVSSKLRLDILPNCVDPCTHSNSIHCDSVFLAFTTRNGSHHKVYRNKMSEEKRTDNTT